MNKSKDGIIIFGHRGSSAKAPENTMAAFRLCRDWGVPGIELDVHLCKDGELAVIHDYNLERTAGKNIVVESLTSSEITNYDVGSWFNEKYSTERIPLLHHVLEEFGDSLYFDIELKDENKGDFGIADAVIETLKAHDKNNLMERIILSSYNPFPLRAVNRKAPQLKTAIIYSTGKKVPPILRHGAGRFMCKCSALKPEKNQVTKFSLFLLRTLSGYSIYPWTVDNIDEARRLIEAGVDGLVSNRPEELLPVITEKGGASSLPGF